MHYIGKVGSSENSALYMQAKSHFAVPKITNSRRIFLEFAYILRRINVLKKQKKGKKKKSRLFEPSCDGRDEENDECKRHAMQTANVPDDC